MYFQENHAPFHPSRRQLTFSESWARQYTFLPSEKDILAENVCSIVHMLIYYTKYHWHWGQGGKWIRSPSTRPNTPNILQKITSHIKSSRAPYPSPHPTSHWSLQTLPIPLHTNLFSDLPPPSLRQTSTGHGSIMHWVGCLRKHDKKTYIVTSAGYISCTGWTHPSKNV